MIKNIVLTDRARNMLHHRTDKKSRQYAKELERSITGLSVEHFTNKCQLPYERSKVMEELSKAINSEVKPVTEMPPEGAVEDINAMQFKYMK